MLPCAAMQSTSAHTQYLRGPVPLVHLLLKQLVKPGDRVVDATCGNGKDTLLLAELVGENGQVVAFDIQESAVKRSAARLKEAGLESRVTLLFAGHEEMARLVTAPLSAVVFNLGWLPGGDRELKTCAESTLPALKSALHLLQPGGVLAITCYPGHEGGDAETAAVLDWAVALPAQQFHLWRMGQLNVSAAAPFCLIIQNGARADVP